MANKEKDTVTIRIPKDPLNPSIKKKRVIVNGKYTEIEVGVDVEVPKYIKEVLDNANELG